MPEAACAGGHSSDPPASPTRVGRLEQQAPMTICPSPAAGLRVDRRACFSFSPAASRLRSPPRSSDVARRAGRRGCRRRPVAASERDRTRPRRRASRSRASAPDAGGRGAGAGRSAAPRGAPRPRRARRAASTCGSASAAASRCPTSTTTLVRDRERWYATRPDYVARMTERGSRYLFHIVEELEQARHADRAGAAAVHRERLQPAGDVGRARPPACGSSSRRPAATSS